MMRKIIYLFVCLLPLVWYSCYEDKGNYDYSVREEIGVDLDTNYTVVSLTGVLDITVHATPEDDYDYLWLLRSETVIEWDTVGHESHLVWPAKVPEGRCDLLLKLTARSDGYSHVFESTVWVTSDYSDGWLVLKELEGATDLDFHSSASEKVTDILVTSVGRRMPGTAGDLSLVVGQNYIYPDGETKQAQNMCWISSSEDAWLVNIGDMSFQRDFSQMFYEAAPSEKPVMNLLYTYRGMLLCTDRNVYFLNNQSAITFQWGFEVDYGPEEMRLGQYAFQGFNGYYFYDQLNQRFLAAGQMGVPAIFENKRKDGTTPLVDVNHTGCSMCYMGAYPTSRDNLAAYAVMADDAARYVYTLSVNSPLSGVKYNPIEEVVALKNKKINEASLFAMHSKLPYIYYADAAGDKVHYYDGVSDEEVENAFSFPGEKITFMKALFYNPTYGPYLGDKFDKFVIATENDGKYKIYLYNLPAGKPDLSEQPEVLEGVGRVSSVQKKCKTMMSSQCSGNFGIGGVH